MRWSMSNDNTASHATGEFFAANVKGGAPGAPICAVIAIYTAGNPPPVSGRYARGHASRHSCSFPAPPHLGNPPSPDVALGKGSRLSSTHTHKKKKTSQPPPTDGLSRGGEAVRVFMFRRLCSLLTADACQCISRLCSPDTRILSVSLRCTPTMGSSQDGPATYLQVATCHCVAHLNFMLEWPFFLFFFSNEQRKKATTGGVLYIRTCIVTCRSRSF